MVRTPSFDLLLILMLWTDLPQANGIFLVPVSKKRKAVDEAKEDIPCNDELKQSDDVAKDRVKALEVCYR